MRLALVLNYRTHYSSMNLAAYTNGMLHVTLQHYQCRYVIAPCCAKPRAITLMRATRGHHVVVRNNKGPSRCCVQQGTIHSLRATRGQHFVARNKGPSLCCAQQRNKGHHIVARNNGPSLCCAQQGAINLLHVARKKGR
jgi:hypothetical protein